MKSRTVNLSEIIKNWSEKLKGEKGRRIILIIGIIGILLILVSSYWPKKTTTTIAKTDEITNLDKYTEEMESRLTDIIQSISDVGKAKVMVTLEGGVEYVYADEQRKSTGKTQDKSGNDTIRTQENDDTQQKLVIVDNPDGGNQALLRLTLQPKVKGVVVVCDGGNQTLVQQRVINAVTTALNISSARVCVIKLIENN